MSLAAREAAAKEGLLPHEFLLRVSRGEEVDGYKPTFGERMDAAKAAAPYYAARLTATTGALALLGPDSRSADELSDEELTRIVMSDKR